MSLVLRLLAHLHGHMGWLAAAALVHPALLLRRTGRRARWVCLAATAIVTFAAAIGAAIYPGYRTLVKPVLFAEAPALGWAFERKEHLAVAAVVLSWVGLVACWTDRHRPRAAPPAGMAQAAYLASAVLAIVSALLGTAVASYRGF